MISFIPRESVEFLPVTVTVDGVPVTTGVTFAVVASGSRPTTWSTPTTLGPHIGVMISGLTPGAYGVWAKIESSPETPVVECGYFTVT